MKSISNTTKIIDIIINGDSRDASMFYKSFDHIIRYSTGNKIRQYSLHRFVDLEDISQAVFVKFFIYASRNVIEFKDEYHLARLIKQMTNNHIIDEIRKHSCQILLLNPDADPDSQVANQNPSPDSEMILREIETEIRRRLTAEEGWLLNQRLAGRTWKQISDECGKTMESIKKQIYRANIRISAELDMD